MNEGTPDSKVGRHVVPQSQINGWMGAAVAILTPTAEIGRRPRRR